VRYKLKGWSRSDCSVPAAHGPKLVTTGLIVRQQFINARLDLYMVLLLLQRLY